jgi:hypothetical protein
MSATAKHYTPKPVRKEMRHKMYGKLHVLWSGLRPDLSKGSQDYKEALYGFAEAELKVTRIGSMTELTDTQLGKLIEVLEREANQPRLYQPSENVIEFKGKPQKSEQKAQSSSVVEHLASLGQRFAINRLFSYLGWSETGREKFLENKFRTKSVEMLLTKQAHSCIRILLNCAGSKYWKALGKTEVSKPMIAAAIPKIKAEIGID